VSHPPLVLSLFPGIGMLDHAFEIEGFCVVRGPDLLWGGDIKRFHPPPDRFEGVIGGVPCQRWSSLAHLVRHVHGEDAVAEDMFPEFERVVAEARPAWFVSECAVFAPVPCVPGYSASSCVVDNRWIAHEGEVIGQVQSRRRRFCFGVREDGAPVDLDLSPDLALFEAQEREFAVTSHAECVPVRKRTSGRAKRSLDLSPDMALFEATERERAVIASGAKEGQVVKLDRGGLAKRTLPGQQGRRTIERCCELQGLPPDFLAHAPFTLAAKYRVVGNGVPIPMGRAVARAVKRAVGYTLDTKEEQRWTTR
jgi:DNA (cytosine-5)-methyltransferase 1